MVGANNYLMGYDRRMEETHSKSTLEERLAASRITALCWKEAEKLYAHLHPEQGWSGFKSLPDFVKARYYDYVEANVPLREPTTVLGEEDDEIPSHLRPDDYVRGCEGCEVGRGTPHYTHESAEAKEFWGDCLNCGLFQTTPHSEHPLTDEQRNEMKATLRARWVKAATDPLYPSYFTTDVRANARIDTLQREVAYQLAKIKADSTLPRFTGPFYEEILSVFKTADKLALDNLDKTGVAYT